MDLLSSLLFSQVEIVLARKPSSQSLYDLLRISSPNLSKDDVLIETKRKKAYRNLLSRIHPDKHPTRNGTTEVFQDVQVFFDESLLLLSTKADSKDKRRGGSESAKENNHWNANRDHPSPYTKSSNEKFSKQKESPLNKREPFRPNSSTSQQSQKSPYRSFSKRSPGAPFPGSNNFRKEKNESNSSNNNNNNNNNNRTYDGSRMDANSMRMDDEESERWARSVISSSSSSSEYDDVEYPKQFHVQEKWNYLTLDEAEVTPTGRSFLRTHLIPNVASLCVNARGAIAHGRKPTMIYKWWDDANVLKSRSVEEFFDHHGGVYTLDSVNDMKDELMTRGPIISTSFRPSEAFLGRMKNSDSLSSSLEGKEHPVLILGWKETSCSGDSSSSCCWLVCPLLDYKKCGVLVIPFGQMNIDDKCVAPKDNFQNRAWQIGSSCFDMDLTEIVGWRYMQDLEVMVESSELEKLGRCFGNDGLMKRGSNSTFLLRNSDKIAHSRECQLENVTWDNVSNQWKLNLHFVDV